MEKRARLIQKKKSNEVIRDVGKQWRRTVVLVLLLVETVLSADVEEFDTTEYKKYQEATSNI